MDEKFGSVVISLGFEVSLDELADALDCWDESREQLIERAKSDFMDTLLYEGAEMYDYLDVEEVTNA